MKERKMEDNKIMDEGLTPICNKLLKVVVGENNKDIINAIPMFLAFVCRDLDNESLSSMLESIKRNTLIQHKDYVDYYKIYRKKMGIN